MQFNRNPIYQSVRFALSTGAIAGLALSGQAFAQDEGDDIELERIETTGSRLSQVDIEGASPVTTIDRADIERIGLTDLADVIRQLPSIGGSPLSTRTNNGGNGATLVDIRGLGAARTLVLINGKRDITAGDFSNIPIAVVERIEVLKEGSAAIYGADAVAGVVNIITRRDFEGAELQAQYGGSFSLVENPAEALDPRFQGTDGDTRRIAFTFGGNSDRGNFVAGIEYNEQAPVFQGQIDSPQFQNVVQIVDDEAFVADGFPGCLTTGSCNDTGGSSSGLGGFFSPADGSFPTQTIDLGTGLPRDFSGATDLYNYAPVNFIQTPFERTSLFFQGDYELFDNVTAYVEARYNNRQSEQALAPTPLFIINDIFDPGAPLDNNPGLFGVPASNVFNPFGVDLIDVRRRVAESDRSFDQEENLIQINSGIRGDFGSFAPTWTYDVSWNWGRERETQLDFGQFIGANFAQAIGPSFFDENGVATCGTPDAPIDGCVPLNLFGGFGTITDEQLAFSEFPLVTSLESQLQLFNATFAGDLLELPGGPLAVAFGYEFRRQEFESVPDSGQASDTVSGNTGPGTSGEFDVDSLFVEVNLPLLSGVPGAELLELAGGFRYDDFSTIGDTGNFQAKLRWQPVQGLLVRGSFAEVFREPGIGELFAPLADSFPAYQDPCSTGVVGNENNNIFATLTPEQQANCFATGVPQGGFFQTNAQPRASIGGGGLGLSPETGETYTVGLAFSPDFLPGFSVTVDYFDVDLSDAITVISAESIVNLCVLAGQQDFCNLVTRQTVGNVGEVDTVIATATNIGGETASGIDWALSYNFNTDFGLFDTRFLGTWLNERESFIFGPDLFAITGDPALADDTIDVVGDFDDRNGITEAVYPEWRLLWTVDWSLGNFGASINMEYLSAVDEDLNAGTVDAVVGPVNEISDEFYLDIVGRYNFPWGTEVSFGITNVTDSDPPFIEGGFNASTDVDTFRLLGRSWFARVTHRF